MLPERYRELLTAYVDGELSGRQRRALQKLLRRSPEARKLLAEMKADSDEIRALPLARLDQDLSDSVLTLIAQRQIQPAKTVAVAVPVPPVAGPVWPYLAAAAAFLLALGVLSYLFFAFSFDLVNPSGTGAKDQSKAETPTKSPPVVADKTSPNKEEEPEDRPLGSGMEDKEPALTLELFDEKKVEAAPLFFQMRLQQLDQVSKRKKWLDELKKTTALRLGLPCANATKAFDHFKAACEAENIDLVIESIARERLKKPAFKTHYLVFLEDVTPDELTHLLQRVAAEDKKSEPQLDVLRMMPLTKPDHEQLSKLIGVDSAPLAGQGGAPSSNAAKSSEKAALVLAYNPVRPNPKAAEIKRWLENRKPPRPGALQVLLVLRSLNG